MNARDVPEEQARAMRCPACGARRSYPCRSASLVARNRTKARACMARRRAWLERNASQSEGESA